MPKDSIAILPQNGYTGVELTSFPAALWLCWIEKTARDSIGEKWADEIEIRLYKSGGGLKKGRGRGQTLGSLKVEGLLLYKTCDEISSVSSSQMKVPPKIYHAKVLDFFGCYFHVRLVTLSVLGSEKNAVASQCMIYMQLLCWID